MVKTLREAVSKADRNLESMLAGIIPTRPDWQYILLNQAFYFGRDFGVTKPYEIVAGIKCNRIIYLIRVFSFCFILLTEDFPSILLNFSLSIVI